MSNAGLARRVNDLGTQRGLTLRYDKTSVARWVTKGMVPQGVAPHLIAAAISSKLGRPVPLHEIGLADADPAPEIGLAFPRDVREAVRNAGELYRMDSGPGRGVWQSLAGSFSVSAYATPTARWLITPADASVAHEAEDAPPAPENGRGQPGGRPGANGGGGSNGKGTVGLPPANGHGHSHSHGHGPGHGHKNGAAPAGAAGGAGGSGNGGGNGKGGGVGVRVGHSDVAKLREAADEARRWDSKYGGGDWRSAMVPECLRSDAAPLLLGNYTDEVGRSLFRATAELTRLAGWMAFDMGQQEAAQRYYIQALRLARAAGDVPLGGYVLASMSLQATYRGFAEEGVDLAQAALERNRSLATAKTMSFFHLVEARALAKAMDATGCAVALSSAESWLQRSREGDTDPGWLDFYAYDRLAADAAECYTDLRSPAEARRFTQDSLSEPTETFVRSHGLRLVVAAVAELEAGNLEAACEKGARAVEVAGRISSARTTDYVRDLLQRLEPYQNVPQVKQLKEAARPLLVSPA
ncbi:hypothetical protein SAMN05421773_12175 [Streptomyces aidingensis]|uniref:Sporulation protein n=2 Tax=Streptomyces aidingensis TaxID=910347 RepID=A0A1I1TWP6_9ACTN|nr:hypothetical protein SAMN05421773_12175 [Streptomyces aidingensis]